MHIENPEKLLKRPIIDRMLHLQTYTPAFKI